MRLSVVLFFLIDLVCCTSCEKIIDVDLNGSSPVLVVEGNISDAPGPHYIRLSKSVNFTEPAAFPPVTGASVTISDSRGNNEILEEISPGMYEAKTITGIHGVTYALSIKVEGAEYKAESTMPYPVSLMELTIEEEWSPGEERKSVVAWFQDLPSTKNYYRFRAQKENRSFNGTYVFEDKAYDGQYIRYAIEPDEDNGDLQLESGNHVEVELQCVDPIIYLYFLTLSQYTGTGRGLPIAPGNPLSNISNGALGYFNAHTTSTKTMVVP